MRGVKWLLLMIALSASGCTLALYGPFTLMETDQLGRRAVDAVMRRDRTALVKLLDWDASQLAKAETSADATLAKAPAVGLTTYDVSLVADYPIADMYIRRYRVKVTESETWLVDVAFRDTAERKIYVTRVGVVDGPRGATSGSDK